jgi:hypothetical protein
MTGRSLGEGENVSEGEPKATRGHCFRGGGRGRWRGKESDAQCWSHDGRQICGTRRSIEG